MEFYSSDNDLESNFISSENQSLISIKTTTPSRVVRISRCPFTCTFCSRTVHYSPLLSVLSLTGLPSATINMAPSYRKSSIKPPYQISLPLYDKCPLFRGGKLISPPSLLSPRSPSPNPYSSQKN